ncbi:MAG TPA: hypothetical protein VK364_07525 [Hymenobacter sp.]|nr:hypothetical protein [Hymenobacter sp.]
MLFGSQEGKYTIGLGRQVKPCSMPRVPEVAHGWGHEAVDLALRLAGPINSELFQPGSDFAKKAFLVGHEMIAGLQGLMGQILSVHSS